MSSPMVVDLPALEAVGGIEHGEVGLAAGRLGNAAATW
jgi:hypothetical protein